MSGIEYISTRGQAPKLSFSDVLLTGLATDGGLYVPETLPQMDFESLVGKSYVAVAQQVIGAFLKDEFDQSVIDDIVQDAYENFDHADVAPIVQLEDNLHILEQFHGPTLAFKDFALQFLGRIFDAVLAQKKRHITIVGATSGDTGSAAIEGCRGRKNMDIFILHPHGRVSDVQRKQMTTVTDSNVHNIALEGSFDDCQDLVKAMFNDAEFRVAINISAVNSINWARIMAQIVYYIYVTAQLGKGVSFSVPTGNFGNIYAGYLARKMGAPIDKLIVATNRNDILYRFIETGVMKAEDVTPSLSPSMDIQISSNFERLLFDMYDRDAERVREAMEGFRKNGEFKMEGAAFSKLKQIFMAYRCDDTLTAKTISGVYDEYQYLLDPHSATGVYAAQQFLTSHGGDVVCMATAHSAKFPDAVKKASGIHPQLPQHLHDLFDRQEKYDILPNDLDTVKTYILANR